MKCKRVIETFLKSNSKRAPFLVFIHLLFCSKCRDEINLLKEKFIKLEDESSFNMSEDLTNNIMNEILYRKEYIEREVSEFKWLFAGILILSSIFLISFSNSFIWLKKYYGSEIEVPISIVMGIIITIYTIAFIGSHLDKLKEVMNYQDRKTG